VNTLEFRTADPLDEDVSGLIRLHLELGRASSPPEDAHALEVDELLDPSIVLFAAHSDDEILAVGALKEIDDDHAEVKTMHTVEWARRRGVGRAMLDHLLAEARRRGYRRVSLETGSMDVFAPARSLYADAGFSPCDPFGDYRPSPNSVYMTLSLDVAVRPRLDSNQRPSG
jgi:putative acetyltransferase